jgi:hypothetical protein
VLEVWLGYLGVDQLSLAERDFKQGRYQPEIPFAKKIAKVECEGHPLVIVVIFSLLPLAKEMGKVECEVVKFVAKTKCQPKSNNSRTD